MTDWKEGYIEEYLTLERKKKLIKKEMAKNVVISILKSQLEDVVQKLEIEEAPYKTRMDDCDLRRNYLRITLAERWDLEAASFKCDTGSATIRTTRSLEIDNKARLIDILQDIGKLKVCIKSWDLTYLRKLTDADLFESGVVHYNKKRSVVIGDVKK